MKVLFADTNLFLQCRDIKELPWDEITGGDDLLLLVPRAVQEEIDRLKHDGNSRRARRAKKANALIREIVLKDDTKLVLCATNPYVEVSFPPSVNLKKPPHNVLDLTRSDDRIIAEAILYKKSNPSMYVSLITHDTNPILTAKRCNLPVIVIPDDWLLEPEPDQKDKKLAALEKRLAELERNFPSITVNVVKNKDQQIQNLAVKITRYPALTDDQIDDLLNIVKAKFPMATDFTTEPKRNSALPLGHKAMIINQRYEPPTESAIKKYQEKEYPKWVQSMQKLLQDLAARLETPSRNVEISLLIANEGGVPAENLVVEFDATSGLFLKYSDDEEQTEDNEQHLLPSPPLPPKGKWVDFHNFRSILDQTSAYARIVPENHYLNLPSILRKQQRDKHTFYWKPERPPKCFPHWAYECEEFRHKVEPEEFNATIYVTPDIEIQRASVKCRVTAKNMPEPLNYVLPVVIDYETGDTLQIAMNLVDSLVHSN
ncbi:MAG: hypothetical protein HYS23_00690 [Geobacter sp.]|nr:hypothetical protein [Geobacter sp.]